jgi:hypothetical protein
MSKCGGYGFAFDAKGKFTWAKLRAFVRECGHTGKYRMPVGPSTFTVTEL